MDVQVESTHHIDASEPDEQGMYEYYYEYDVYRFSAGGASLIAKSYVDTPEQANFVSINPESGQELRLLKRTDLAQPLFRMAYAYFQAQGKTDLRWLGGSGKGYENVPAT